ELLGELVDLLALLADDGADLGGEDEDHHLLAGAFDTDARDPRLGVALLDVLADLLVLDQEVREVALVRVPVAEPGDHDPGTEASGSNFLPHECTRSPSYLP